jgi:hypothetical protein
MATMKALAIQHWREQRMNVSNVLMLLAIALLTAACGGGGGGAASSAPVSASSQPASVAPPAPATATFPSVSASDLDLAVRIYKGDARTPEGFDVEARPANVAGTVSTRHLKNTDFATGPQGMNPMYEVCTNDLAQAIAWSEKQSTWQGQYSDLAEVHSDTRMFELVRVPRADVTAVVRHRVFRCDYLDRSGSDLRSDAGAAGSMNQRPLTASELEKLAEYLWQFTMFNNSDYAVESSQSSLTNGVLVETIRMGQLIRGTAGGCDTVQVSDWTHTMNSTDGTLTRALTPVRSFQVRGSSSSAESCSN